MVMLAHEYNALTELIHSVHNNLKNVLQEDINIYFVKCKDEHNKAV